MFRALYLPVTQKLFIRLSLDAEPSSTNNGNVGSTGVDGTAGTAGCTENPFASLNYPGTEDPGNADMALLQLVFQILVQLLIEIMLVMMPYTPSDGPPCIGAAGCSASGFDAGNECSFQLIL